MWEYVNIYSMSFEKQENILNNKKVQIKLWGR